MFTGERLGGRCEDNKDTQEEVIKAINEKFGLDLDALDRLESEKLKLTLLRGAE